MSTARLIATTIAAYVAWAVTTVLSVGVLIAWHALFVRLYVALHFSKWGLAFYNNMVVLFLVGFWLVLVVATEGWFRRGIDEGLLVRRVVSILIGLAVAGGVALLLRFGVG